MISEKEVGRLAKLVTDERVRVERIEGELERARVAVAAAIEERRKILLDGADPRTAERRAAEVERALGALIDARAIAAQRLADAELALNETRAGREREQRAQEIAGHIPRVETALESWRPLTKQLIEAFANAQIAEAQQAERLLSEVLQQIEAHVPFTVGVLKALSAQALVPPPPKPATATGSIMRPAPERVPIDERNAPPHEPAVHDGGPVSDMDYRVPSFGA